MTIGIVGFARPLADAELRAQALADEEADEATIRAWVAQRRTVAHRARALRAIGFGATAAGLLLSAALVDDASQGSDIAGFETLAGTDADVSTARRTLAVLGGVSAGIALTVGLLPGPEDRLVRRLEGADGAVVSVAVAGRGLRFGVAW